MSRTSILPAHCGVGLKPAHYEQAMATWADTGVGPRWFEVHPQNYSAPGGTARRWLNAFRERATLSFHSVGLSLGSADGVDTDELERLAVLVEQYEPTAVSDHLSWSRSGNQRFPDLLPVPYTQAVLDHFVREVGKVQDRLGRRVLIENPSRYLAFAVDEMSEPDFLTSISSRAGCGLLLDLNNIVVSACNLGLRFDELLAGINPEAVEEIHLAGHKVEEHDSGPLCVDDHGSAVGSACWALFDDFVSRHGPRPTLVEWDTDVPTYDVLTAEVAKAEAILQRSHRVDAVA